MEFNYPEGATPLDPNEIDGLLLTHITTKPELDRWEQDNINEALAWVEQRTPKDILNESFMKQLHKRMFGNVWKWAGDLRKTEKNLGFKAEYTVKEGIKDYINWLNNTRWYGE